MSCRISDSTKTIRLLALDFYKIIADSVSLTLGFKSNYHLTLAFPISANPKDSFLFIPPDRNRVCALDLSESLMDSIIFSISPPASSRVNPFNLPKNHKCSLTVRVSYNTSCCGHKPEEITRHLLRGMTTSNTSRVIF